MTVRIVLAVLSLSTLSRASASISASISACSFANASPSFVCASRASRARTFT